MKLRHAFRPAYFEARHNGFTPVAAYRWALSVQSRCDKVPSRIREPRHVILNWRSGSVVWAVTI